MKKIVIAVVALIVVVLVVMCVVRNPDTGAPINPTPMSGKLNINTVCEGALAYMTFTDGAAADKFVQECKAGEHPEVIEKYKKDMNLGDGAQI